MKLLSILLMTFFLGKGCEAQQKQDLETAVVEYTANTRGFYQKIVVQNKMAAVSKDRSGNDKLQTMKISAADWKELVDDFQSINLEGIPDLKSPTQKRFYDGAAIANLKITFKGKTYETNGFDHGHPPAEIAKLVNKINTFVKKE